MGTQFNFLTYGVDEDFFASAKIFISNELERIEHKFSRFDEESEIYRINKLAATETVTTDAETISLLTLCQEYYLKTNKLFNVTVGKFTHSDLQHDQKTTDKEPEYDSGKVRFKDALLTGTDKISIKVEEKAVRFLNPLISIDLGGIGKGYALEKIKQYCVANRLTNSLINFGNSSITAIGKHPHGDYWPIGIQDAFSPDSSLHLFRLKDLSLSTSGNTPNNRTKFGSSGHILNPLTGEFQKESRTVSVVTNSPIEAEVLSTSLFIAPEKEKEEILSRFKPKEAVEIAYDQVNGPKVIDMNQCTTMP
ncbi:MAG: FAD:protein FMN transferase [Bacteroidota bacterium]|nr:FAD:protein FMN transferase [Bacteroidota bacterium]